MIARSPAPGKVGDLSLSDFRSRLEVGLGIRIGPFAANVSSNVETLADALYSLYQQYQLVPDKSVFSFHARLVERRKFGRRHRRAVRFSVDGRAPHEDMPVAQALPVLEWGINLVIALRSHCYLMLHSAVAEIGGSAMLLPAAPGFGKTTLCTGLSLSGWRLLSDEFGLVRPGTVELTPVPRPMALKNESIAVIREFAPEATIGPEVSGTRKGTVAHVKPPSESINRSDETASIRWIVFPRWRPAAQSTLAEVPKAEAFMLLATNAFNYELLGESAYRTVAALIDQARCFYFEYSDLQDAVAVLTDLASSDES